MKKTIIKKIILLAFILSSFNVCAKTTDSQGGNKKMTEKNTVDKNIEKKENKEEKEIIELYNKFYEYKINKNIEGLKSILSSDFHLIHMTGYDQSREEWFSQIEDEQMKYYSGKVDDIKISVNGNKAELIGQARTDARIYSSRNTWRLQLKMQLEKRDEKWIIINAVASTY